MKLLVVFVVFVVATYGDSANFGYPYLVGMTDDARLAVTESILNKNSNAAALIDNNTEVKPFANCSYVQFTNNLNKFIIDAGFNEAVNYTNNGDDLVNEVNALFKRLKTSSNATMIFNKFCIAERQFFSLLSVDQVESCINPPSLVSWGYSSAQAVKTVQFFKQVNYQCSTGFKTYISNFVNYLSAYASNIDVLNKCETAFNTGLSNTPSDPCPALDTYSTCVGSVYKNISVDQAWTACEVVRITNLLIFHKCRDRLMCQISAFKS